MHSLKVPVGTSVRVRISVRNCCGWSDYTEAPQTIKISQLPPKPEKPSVLKVSPTGFKLQWNESVYSQIVACGGVPRYSGGLGS